jgi:hypothetical protein
VCANRTTDGHELRRSGTIRWVLSGNGPLCRFAALWSFCQRSKRTPRSGEAIGLELVRPRSQAVPVIGGQRFIRAWARCRRRQAYATCWPCLPHEMRRLEAARRRALSSSSPLPQIQGQLAADQVHEQGIRRVAEVVSRATGLWHGQDDVEARPWRSDFFVVLPPVPRRSRTCGESDKQRRPTDA